MLKSHAPYASGLAFSVRRHQLRCGTLFVIDQHDLLKPKRSAKNVHGRRRSVQHIQSDLPATSRPSSRALNTPLRSLNRARTDIPSDTCEQSEPLQQPHRYVQASAVELTDELPFMLTSVSFFICTTRGRSFHLQHTAILPPFPVGLSPHSHMYRDRGDDRKTSLSSHFPGLVLPSRPVCDFLLQSYWRSVHWFMMLFYKPSFEHEYRQIISNQHVTAQQGSTAVLILMVLAIGARYASNEQRSKVGISEEELSSLQRDMLKQIRLHYLDVLDTGGVECVQLCILLSTYYLYNGKPNLALPILGAGIHSAQAQSLHKESLWGPATGIVVEVRKRTCMPRDMDDISNVHPLLNSIESPASHSPAPVTLGSYQRHKFDLYSIATPVIGNIHNVHVSSSEVAMNQAAEINSKLVEWFDQLPVELRLEHNVDLDLGSLTSAEADVCQLFQLQALALQLAYDNIQIILHRPFIRCTRRLPAFSGLSESDARRTSFEQCKHCARRTCSILPRYAKLLYVAQTTHAAAYIAIQNFTAGVTLAMVALSDPGSEQSCGAKRGVANSIVLQKTLAASSIVPSQTVRVLEGLFQLIFKQEMQSLLGNPSLELDSPSPMGGPPNQSCEPEDPQPPGSMQFPMVRRFNQIPSRGGQEDSEPPSSVIEPEHRSQLPLNDHAAINRDLAQDVPVLSFYSGIDHALESVQQVLWENCDPMAHPGDYIPPTSSPQADICGHPRPFVGDFADENNRFQSNSLASVADPTSQDINTLNNSFLGQSWLWNQPDFDFLREQ
ncbi:hypothetical protein N7481_007341 [Penicillium waksmanii]|uniref:uncharacterized protein n=1 Tax=Penicillium waksmanii TaxID=69791 RepID=UPI0025483273|nr:uncharacterized protein N7481_007341 [Penicillium waksmanii]KAJ5980043.1 hypothetical protein N7481_007341 [Penicillium waksmanii]